jgi:type I restriction enzyme S subunit
MSWPVESLGDLCHIEIGRTPARNQARYWGAGSPWLSIADMNGKKHVSTTKEQITTEAVRECRCRQVQPGTVLMSFKLSLGRVAMAACPIYTNEAIAALPIKNAAKLCPEYLYWALQQIDFTLGQDRAAKGLTLNKPKLAALKIPVPPLDEQRRIAAILDQAEELRAKRRAALALLDQLPQSIFLEMFGEMNAKAVTLGDYTERVTKGTTPTTLGFSFTDSGIPLLRVQNLREDRIDFTEDVLYIARDTHLALARSQIRPGDVLTTIAGTIGRTVIVPGDAPEANCNQAIAIITPKADLHRQYLRYWLSSPAAQRQISQGQVTATISNLSLGQIKGLTISLPNLELQQRFAIRVEAVQRAKTAQLSALFEIDALFSSLQESAFGGHP